MAGKTGKIAKSAPLGDAVGQAEIVIAKNHHGPTGPALARFDGPTTRFSDAA